MKSDVQTSLSNVGNCPLVYRPANSIESGGSQEICLLSRVALIAEVLTFPSHIMPPASVWLASVLPPRHAEVGGHRARETQTGIDTLHERRESIERKPGRNELRGAAITEGKLRVELPGRGGELRGDGFSAVRGDVHGRGDVLHAG